MYNVLQAVYIVYMNNYTNKLKISRETYEELERLVKPLDREDYREKYRALDIPRAEFVKDINQRYRWDLMWAATRDQQSRGVETVVHQMYAEGLNDTNIDSALKAIVAPL